MKRIIALILAALMVCVVFAACGDSSDTARTVTTSVEAKYDDGYAKGYASSTSTDSSGKTTYEFTGDKYDEFIYDYKNEVGKEITKDVTDKHGSDYGQFCYVNTESNSVIIGVNPGKYDAAAAEADAPAYAEYGFKYFQNLENPVSAIKVVYCNANDQTDVYGSFDFSL